MDISQVQNAYVLVTWQDGRTRYAVPVSVIARDRAENYKDEFGDDVERSLAEDTYPLFAESEYDITDWACNNMNWEDFGDSPIRLPDIVSDSTAADEWGEAEKDLISVEEFQKLLPVEEPKPANVF